MSYICLYFTLAIYYKEYYILLDKPFGGGKCLLKNNDLFLCYTNFYYMLYRVQFIGKNKNHFVFLKLSNVLNYIDHRILYFIVMQQYCIYIMQNSLNKFTVIFYIKLILKYKHNNLYDCTHLISGKEKRMTLFILKIKFVLNSK